MSETGSLDNIPKINSPDKRSSSSKNTKKSKNSNNNNNQKNKPAKPSFDRPPTHKKAKRPPLTHFLCIPLVTRSSESELERSLNELHRKAANVRASAYLDETNSSPTTTTTETVTTTTETSPHDEDLNNRPLPCQRRHQPRRPCCYIPEDAIRPLGTLHLTLAVLSLGSEERLARAAETLLGLDLSGILRDVEHKGQMASTSTSTSTSSTVNNPSSSSSFSSSSSPPNPLTITLHSLRAMRSAKATSVLYAHPHDPTSLLLPFCEAVRSVFWETDLLGEENDDRDRQLHLHATMVNTIYARGIVPALGGGGGTKKSRKAAGLKLDARGWVEEYEGHIWAESIPIEKVSLCRMAAEKVEGACGARYKEIAANYFAKT